MQEIRLESRPLYGIGTVARMTGLKPDTLRVWERRYGLGASHKSGTGRRQYTQSDLEHLQLVASLVRDGVRIGEIASVERKTLQMMIRDSRQEVPVERPRVLFVGTHLCDWLDEHQGCVAGCDALLARADLAAFLGDLPAELGAVDTLVVECPNLGAGAVGHLRDLAGKLEAGHVVVVYRFGNSRWVEDLQRDGIVAQTFPPEPARLAFEISQSAAHRAASAGDRNLGDLVRGKARQFNEAQLSAARKLQSRLDCECPRHISDLIGALADFEEYSANCSVEGWKDAAIHACIYTYTNQARWLMEKALQAALEEHPDGLAPTLPEDAGVVVSL
jgi:hypothetical protein